MLGLISKNAQYFHAALKYISVCTHTPTHSHHRRSKALGEFCTSWNEPPTSSRPVLEHNSLLFHPELSTKAMTIHNAEGRAKILSTCYVRPLKNVYNVEGKKKNLFL